MGRVTATTQKKLKTVPSPLRYGQRLRARGYVGKGGRTIDTGTAPTRGRMDTPNEPAGLGGGPAPGRTHLSCESSRCSHLAWSHLAWSHLAWSHLAWSHLAGAHAPLLREQPVLALLDALIRHRLHELRLHIAPLAEVGAAYTAWLGGADAAPAGHRRTPAGADGAALNRIGGQVGSQGGGCCGKRGKEGPFGP